MVNCEKPGVAKCSQCKVLYCGEACQASDWPHHMRVCRPPPPLEYPDQGGRADSLSVEVNQPAGDQSTSGTKKDGGTDGKAKKKEEENTNTPVQVNEVSKLPEEVAAVQPISPSQMAAQEVSAGLQDIDLLEVVQIVSPAEFSISLVAEVKLCLIFAVSFHHFNLFRLRTTSSWSAS